VKAKELKAKLKEIKDNAEIKVISFIDNTAPPMIVAFEEFETNKEDK
tara:strand:+ start:21288 stop:21428 length:141 start_codon:yes stop_codon:yes gene_type:complete